MNDHGGKRKDGARKDEKNPRRLMTGEPTPAPAPESKRGAEDARRDKKPKVLAEQAEVVTDAKRRPHRARRAQHEDGNQTDDGKGRIEPVGGDAAAAAAFSRFSRHRIGREAH